MLLVIDVGNTNTVVGVYSGDELVRHWRLQTHHGRTSDEHGIFLRQLFELSNLDATQVDGAIISCVVPPMERLLVEMIGDYFACRPRVVGDDVEVDIAVRYEKRQEVGADRLVNAIAAWERFETAVIVVDFGTATTFDAISASGEYLGGAIAPGTTVSSESLFRAASKLPKVELSRPPQVIGKTTVHSVQAGLLYGYIGQIRELVSRMKQELADPVAVIATGGGAEFFADETDDIIDEVDELLTMEGLRLVYRQA